jgi:hypothetical protein
MHNMKAIQITTVSLEYEFLVFNYLLDIIECE